ncbi:MAG: hypothetical protein V3W28_06430 [Thermoplasmata archaeon]
MMPETERADEEAEGHAGNRREEASPVLRDIELESKLNTLIDKRLVWLDKRLAPGAPGKIKPAGASEKIKPRRRKRMVSARFAVLLAVLAVTGTAFALTQTTLSTELIELWKSQTAATDFTTSSFVSTPSGDNDLKIEIKLDNDDAGSAHQANVTVNILNAAGDEIANLTQATGSVPASGQAAMTFEFNQANIVPNYETAQIVVKQSS